MAAVVRLALLLATVALLIAAPQVSASPQDVSATHAYIQADYALARASVGRIGAVQAKIEQLNATLARECPHSTVGVPEDEASQPLSHEPVVAMWAIAYGTNAASIRAFVSVTNRLHWSNPRTTSLARRYARSLKEMATLPMPDLCADVRSWRESDFQVVPAGTLRLVEHAEAIELNPVPSQLLAPYERGADASTLARAARLETKLEEHEFGMGQEDWQQLLDTLGLTQ